jgi:hypothetical protein
MTKKKIDISDLTSVDTETGEQVLGTSVATNIWNILMRIVAVFAASGLSVIGAGALVGIDTVKAMILAGTLGVATVVERLARGFLDDGKLTADEINSAFASVDKKQE